MQVAHVLRRGRARFELATVPVPVPGPGQVLIRVESCGVNFSDVKRRRGDAYPFETSFPFVPGGEIAGEVVAHGPGVQAPPIGASVFALAGANGYGGYAQFATSFAQTAVPIPNGLSADAASTLLVAGSTAKIILRDVARLQPGESVLIPAATGGVGSFAIQLARRVEAGRIIAAVGDASKQTQALALGAHEVVVYSSDAWPDQVRELTGGKGVDVALESNGGEALEQTFRCLASFGRLVVYGAASGTAATLSSKTIDSFLYAPAPNQTITGFNVGGWFMERPAAAAAALTELIAEVLGGHVTLPPVRTLRLAEAANAHELLEGRKTSGKLVIKPWA
ncbi:MAG: zinc-binding dehydrogenase [Deltaproteobacteria bacterium]|nr:zinc-binding dehydrogenase [Nannocystaceae bacterium]